MAERSYEPADLQKAAALYCEGWLPQDIAEVMSLPTSSVQRMLEHAEQYRYIEYRPHLTVDPLLQEARDFVHDETLTAALRKVLTESLELDLLSLHITPSPRAMFERYSTRAAEDSAEHRQYRDAEYVSLRAAASRAADELCRCLFDGADHTIGVNWGTSVKLTIDAMRPLPAELTDARLSVISLFGDIDFHPQDSRRHRLGSAYVNSNRHVTQLASRLGGRAEQVPLNVPGFVPAEFANDPEVFRGIRTFLGRHASYLQIFGELPSDDPTKPRKYNGIIDVHSDARITKMDTIITGFGSADSYTDTFHFLGVWLNDAENQTLLRYCANGMVVGDIAGHLIASLEGKDDAQLQQFLRRINQRILAAQPSDFADVASRHRKTRAGAGVVGVTVGARKAKVVARLLSLTPCPISALFIDTHCALALLAELSTTEFHRFVTESGARLTSDVRRWSKDTRRLIPVGAKRPARVPISRSASPSPSTSR
ncbi:MAG TPA: hypothetical protein VEK57_19695 [Thermoanaerobaculia bacterium]|nr:hypothetical protein [Thermoanaerobaculia bacterium]